MAVLDDTILEVKTRDGNKMCLRIYDIMCVVEQPSLMGENKCNVVLQLNDSTLEFGLAETYEDIIRLWKFFSKPS